MTIEERFERLEQKVDMLLAGKQRNFVDDGVDLLLDGIAEIVQRICTRPGYSSEKDRNAIMLRLDEKYPSSILLFREALRRVTKRTEKVADPGCDTLEVEQLLYEFVSADEEKRKAIADRLHFLCVDGDHPAIRKLKKLPREHQEHFHDLVAAILSAGTRARHRQQGLGETK